MKCFIRAGLAILLCSYFWLPCQATQKSSNATPLTETTRAPKSGFIVTPDKVRIHYLEARPRLDFPLRGDQRRPSILFVTGWMTPGWIWEHQIAHFGKNYRVVVMDPRSQGESSKPSEGHYPAARARDIKSVIDQLKLAPVLLVASTIAVTEAVSYVDQFGTSTLAGLVLVNGIAGRDYDAATTLSLLEYAGSFQIDRRKAAERFVRGMYTKPQSETYIAKMVRATMQMPTNSVIALFLGSLTTDNRQALGKIDRPTLIVAARVNAWMQFYEDLQRRIKGSRMEVFDNTGHALFVEEAVRFNNLIEEFLKGLAAD